MHNPFTDYMFTPQLYKVYTGIRRNDVSINPNNFFKLLHLLFGRGQLTIQFKLTIYFNASVLVFHNPCAPIFKLIFMHV